MQKMGRWMWTKKAKTSWINERKGCKNKCEILRISQICRTVKWSRTKRCGSRNCKISSRNGMIFCSNITKSRKYHRSCKACKTERSSARGTGPNGLETVRSPTVKSVTERSRRRLGLKQSWMRKSEACKQEMKGVAAVHPRHVDVASTQDSCSSLSRWEQNRQCSSSPVFRVKSAEYMAGSVSQRQPLRCTCRREEKEETKMGSAEKEGGEPPNGSASATAQQ